MSVSIRPTNDLDQIKELNNELFADSPITDSELESSDWWLAMLDGNVVGFCGVELRPLENKAFLARAGVLPVARGGGLQKRFIRLRANYAKRHGIARCYTYVWAGNFASMRSLIACKFKPYYLEKDVKGTFIYFENKPAVREVS